MAGRPKPAAPVVFCGACGATMVLCRACAERTAYALRCPNACRRPVPVTVEMRLLCSRCCDALREDVTRIPWPDKHRPVTRAAVVVWTRKYGVAARLRFPIPEARMLRPVDRRCAA